MNKTTPFICPICGENLNLVENKSWLCAKNHCYDIAKSGYTNLLLVNKKNSLIPGDNKEMIVARVDVMSKDYYKGLADCIVQKLMPFSPKIVLDAGCGIGYMPFRIKTAFPTSCVIGTDISKFAVESAAKTYKDIHFAVASSNSIPLKNDSVDCIICAFAPVFIEEIDRVLKKDGVFIRVTPDVRHLFNLKQFLYENARENELDPENLDGLNLVDTVHFSDNYKANNSEILSLVKMTPYYYHTKASDLQKLQNIDSLDILQNFLVRIYTKN